MLASIIILHHNKAPYSRACLESLLHTRGDFEIINVDNGSRDETPDILREFETRLNAKTLTFDTNIGAIRGRNAALEVARGEVIAFLDNDVICGQSEWLEILKISLFSRPNCGIVVPKLLFPWAPFAIECLGAAVSPSGRIEYLERGQPRDKNISAREIQCAISAGWLMKREVVEKIGLLDEVFSPVQYEDMDFCYRARAAGFSVWTEPRAEIFHFEHTTTAGSDDINFRYVTAKNAIEFKRRYGSQFRLENATTEENAQWKILPKLGIEAINWRALLAQGRGVRDEG